MKKKTKIIHIVDFKGLNTIILGRGNDAHVKISDISISRKHAHLKVIKDKEIWLEDFDSKFGSLLIQNDPVEVDQNSGQVCLQVGRTFLTITCKLPSSCCCTKPVSMKRGFPVQSYLEDFPLAIKELILPKKLLLDVDKESFEGNHDFIDYSEKVTNSNLLDTHVINNLGKHKSDHINNPLVHQED